MRVAVYPADEGGCGYYRMIWPAKALIDQGYDVEIHLPDTDGAQIQAVVKVDHQRREQVVDVNPPDADVVVLQRPLARLLADSIPFLQKKGKVVVVELDDDFEAINPRNTAWMSCHPTYSPERNWRHLNRACDLADLVVVSTPALAAQYASHGRVEIIPNFVPERYLKIERQPGEDPATYLGWSGSVATHPDDLQVVRGGVWAAMKAGSASLAVVGTGVGVHRHLSLPKDLEIKITGWVLIDKYPEALAELDVGIVPLELSRFNQSKSWLKGIEYASLGVPFVASPTSPYVELASLGLGVIAHHPKQWQRLLTGMLSDRDTTRELGRVYRERVDALDLTIERQAIRWISTWAKARRANVR